MGDFVRVDFDRGDFDMGDFGLDPYSRSNVVAFTHY